VCDTCIKHPTVCSRMCFFMCACVPPEVPLPEPEKLAAQLEALKHVDLDALAEKVGTSRRYAKTLTTLELLVATWELNDTS